MTSPDAGWLQDILDSAQRIVRFTSGMTEEQFLQDEKTQHAVVRCLEIIGEAANNVSAETRDSLAVLSWSKIIAQRHVAIHHYRKLDYRRIWTTVRDDLRPLIEQLDSFLKDLS